LATTAGLLARARLELGDVAQTFQTRILGDGATTLVTLSYKPVQASTLVITKQNVSGSVNLVGGVNYTLDDGNGLVTFAAPLENNATYIFNGQAFRYFSDTDWTTFVTTAALQHLHQRDGVTLVNLDPVEEYPITLLAVTEALYSLLNDAAFDIDINTPEGVGIPRHQRYQQLTDMLVARLDQYDKLSSALNVGLNRIEMFDLRRVSRTTNKLIPLYREQEFEDTRFPVRIFVPIDLKGGAATPDTVPDVSLAIIQGMPFTTTQTVGMDVTTSTIVATLRKYKASGALAYFTVAVTNAATGAFTASLTADRTYSLGGGPYWWDVRVMSNGVATEVLEGPVTFEERPRN
jgi:hypothetical protein